MQKTELQQAIKKIVHGDTPDHFMSDSMLAKPDEIMQAIDTHIEAILQRVIGEDEPHPLDLKGRGMKALDVDCRNKFRAEQRK